jgi:hypothetical protein
MRLLKIAISAILLVGAVIFCVWLAETVSYGHWGFSISVSFLFMLVFSLIFGTVFKPAYSSGYFTSKPFERGGTIYRWFGVKQYIFLLRLIGWERLLRKDQPIKNNLESLAKFEATTRGSETAHLLAALMVALITIWFGWKHSFRHIQWLVLSNIFFNVYPVLLQRYNRPRVSRLIIGHQLRRRRTQPGSAPY